MSIEPPLKVALVTARFPVGSQLFIYDLALSLASDGIAVEILPVDGADSDGVADLGPLAAAADLVRYPPAMDRIGAIARAFLHPLQTRVDIRHPRRWARTTRRARLFEAAGDFDVVHAQFATLGPDLLRQIELGSLESRALVVHLRGYDISSHVRKHGPRVYDRLFERADLFIANCVHFRDVAINLGCPPDKCVVIGSPCDTDYFVPPITPRALPDGRPLHLVAVGRLVEKKGFVDAIDAIAILVAQGRDVTLNILGDGPERITLETRIAHHGLGTRVRMIGSVGRAQILTALHASDIGLAPSVTASTGDQDAPVNTLKEQMATGLPVIATRHGGIPELVIDGQNGRLVPERDPAAIARAVEDLVEQSESWADLGRAGREKVVEDYDRRIILAKTRTAYRMALEPCSHTKFRKT